jgi:hypothetical protein
MRLPRLQSLIPVCAALALAAQAGSAAAIR